MSNFRDKLSGNSLYYLSQIIRKTGRFHITGLDNLENAQSTGRPMVFVAWHGMTMMLVSFFKDYFDPSSIVLLMPDDWRGEALQVFANKLGAQPYPMDLKGDGNMATARKLMALIKQVKKGNHCYITPDGPDGPGYLIKPGVAYIAQKTNALIIPAGAYARNAYRLNRWDQYTVPYPFSRVSINVGQPMEIEKKTEDFSELIGKLTDSLHRVTAQAAANFYEQR